MARRALTNIVGQRTECCCETCTKPEGVDAWYETWQEWVAGGSLCRTVDYNWLKELLIGKAQTQGNPIYKQSEAASSIAQDCVSLIRLKNCWKRSQDEAVPYESTGHVWLALSVVAKEKEAMREMSEDEKREHRALKMMIVGFIKIKHVVPSNDWVTFMKTCPGYTFLDEVSKGFALQLVVGTDNERDRLVLKRPVLYTLDETQGGVTSVKRQGGAINLLRPPLTHFVLRAYHVMEANEEGSEKHTRARKKARFKPSSTSNDHGDEDVSCGSKFSSCDGEDLMDDS